MIRINLYKKERRKITLPDLSKLREVKVRDLLKDKALYILPLIGVVVIGGEVLYVYRLQDEINSLRVEVNNLKAQRNELKRRAEEIQAQRRALQNEINQVRARIRYLEASKDVFLTLKEYYEPFNTSLGYLFTLTPSTVWFDGLSQTMDFNRVSVKVDFGSYSVDYIKDFFMIMKSKFPLLTMGEIRMNETDTGMIYYVSSVEMSRDIKGGGE